MHYSYVDYGNGMAEVIKYTPDGRDYVIVRLVGEHAATEAYVIASALRDAYQAGYDQGCDDCY